MWEARQDCARGRGGGGGGLGGVVEVEAVEGKLLLSSQFNVKPHVVNVNLVNLDTLGILSLRSLFKVKNMLNFFIFYTIVHMLFWLL